MLRSKLTVLILAVCICVCISGFALAESTVSKLWNSGCSLLFYTDNVTVDGQAVFSIDGDRFKTAHLHYVQDGFSSLYDWKLLTPEADGSELETGWTIIADEEGYYYLMEVFYPGTYRVGSDDMQNTLLRRSVELDSLVDLGDIIMKQLTLPEGTVAESEKDGKKSIHITLNAEQIPDLAASALNLGAGFLADRWFGYGHDRFKSEENAVDFYNYITVTEALADGTVRWLLREMDMDFTLDDQQRLTGINGTLCTQSVFWDGTIRNIALELHVSMTDYGESHVKPFDPADYGVVRVSDYDVTSAEK